MAKDSQVQTSIYKIVSTIIGSVLVGAIFGGVSMLRLVDSTTYKAIANEQSIIDIKKEYVSKNEYGVVLEKIEDFEKKFDTFDQKFDRVFNVPK